MDKNKNRTDLLAAGRKRLQQFRQKKDSKGSSSQGKSSKKSSRSGQNEAHTDSVPDTADPAAMPQVPEQGIVSQMDSNLGDADSSVSHSIENSMPSDANIATVDPLSTPIRTETTPTDTDNVDNCSVEVNETDTDSPHPDNGKNIDLLAPCATVEMEIGNREVEELLHTPDTSLILTRGDQEADGLGLKQFHGSDVAEFQSDGTLADHVDDPETTEKARSEQTGMVGTASQLKEEEAHSESASASATDISDGLLISTSRCSKAGGTFGADHKVENQIGEIVDVGSLNVEDSQNISESDQVDRSMEAYKQQYMPEESFVFVGKSHEEPMLTKLTNLDDDFTISPPRDVCPGSFSQLIEVIKGLNEDDYNLLLMSRGLPNSFVSLPPGLPALTERLNQELFLTSCTKDILLSQLIEQADLQAEYDDRFHQLHDEISVLRASLYEAHENHGSLTNALLGCRSELQATLSQREEIQSQFDAARSKVEEVSARANELQNSLEGSQLDLLSLSKELAESKDLVEALHSEKENLIQSTGFLNEDRNKLMDEKNICVRQNEKLLGELADCKNLVAALQVESSNLSEALSSVTEKSKSAEEEKNFLANDHEKLSLELSNCRSLMEALQVENSNLRGDLIVITEERKKLEEEKEYAIHEMERLSSELLDLRERLSKDYGEREMLEVELKEMTMCLEQLTEENIFLQSSLELHKAKMEEIDDSLAQKLSPDGEGLNQVGSLNVLSRGRDKEAVDEQSRQIPGNKDSEQKQPHKLYQMEAFDDSLGFVVFRGHLEEAENCLQKLEKEIEEMHSRERYLSRTGSKLATPAVSKLIQAFESKVQHDEHEAEDRAATEDQSLAADQSLLTRDHVADLKAVLRQLALDSENASSSFKAERDDRIAANLMTKELKFQIETMEVNNDNLEAINIELGVLYEALKQHLSTVKEENQELEGLCETLKQHGTSLKEENSELCRKLSEQESRNIELQNQLIYLQQNSDELASVLRDQLENFQKEAADKALAAEQERNSFVAQIVEAVEKLDGSTGFLITPLSDTGRHGLEDTGSHATASVNAAIEIIEDLKEKLEAARSDHELTCNLFKEVNEKHSELLEKNVLTNGTLHRLYAELRKLVIDSCGSLGETELDIHKEELPDLADYSGFESLMVLLGKFTGEMLQLQSVNNNLNFELMSRTKDAEELNRRCVDPSSIEKLIELVEGVIKLEDEMVLEGTAFSHLESLVSFLVEKFKEVQEQVSSSKEEFASKVEELSNLQEKVDQLTALKLQHETELENLQGRLSQFEEALHSMRSELQEKVSELEQSEQRVSSIREKLSIAVAKGKGLISQRDSLKQSLSEISSELERCSQELQLKDARLLELESKLKTYSEAGERVEALESELSYIRNSATALRESFLLKDSVLQRIEEILEDLDLPEHFHSRDIIEKVDWLARSATGNSLPPTDWDQKGSVGGSYSDTGFVVMDAWKEDVQPGSSSGDDLRRKYEEIQGKFYGLAEQNEMLEQSLMERNQLVQRWEELLDRIDIPAHLRSVEPDGKIEWLGNALLEVNYDKNSLLQDIEKLETHCESLTADLEQSEKRISCLISELEDSQKRISDLETDIKAVNHERENLCGRLEILSCDHEKLSLDNGKLQNEVSGLQEQLVQKLGNEEHIQRINGEIHRMQDLICETLKDPGANDLIYGEDGIQCLEALLRKLIEKYTTLSLVDAMHGDADENKHAEEVWGNLDERTRDIMENIESEGALVKRDEVDANSLDVDILKKELEEALSELVSVKEERDRYMEKQQSLVSEVEAHERKRVELQELLNLEEQKSSSVREKLNVAVRKGKSLVQQRDSLKQTIEGMSTELEHLKSEIKHRENSLADYKVKIRDLTAYTGRVEELEAECSFMRNRLAENDRILQEKDHNLTMILNVLGGIDVGEIHNSDPIKKLEHIGKLYHDLHAAVVSLQQESGKSRRAAELLLAELNEVQDRNDGLQEELSKVTVELTQLSKDRDEAEAAKSEALSHLEQLSLVCSEEKRKSYSQLLLLKSAANQLGKSLSDIKSLLAHFFDDDSEFRQNLESGLTSCLDRAEADIVVHLPPFTAYDDIKSSNSANKGNLMPLDFSSQINLPEHLDDGVVTEVCSSFEVCIKEIDAVKTILHEHSATAHKQASNISKLMGSICRDMNSQRELLEAAKQEIKIIESVEKQKEMEIVVLRRNIELLYDACCSSLVEIENRKAEVFANNLPVGDVGMNLKSLMFGDGRLPFGENNYSSEEHVKTMAEKLLSAVKDLAGFNGEMIEGNKKEMKNTISNLQQELQEKDIQRERICKDLVSQIKQAEAAAASYSLDLQSSKSHVHDLEKRLEMMEDEQNLLKRKVEELKDQQAITIELREEVRSLTDRISAKDQEIEALMQALDEEEVQMEDSTKKVEELEKVVQQKNLDIESLEASRGKAVKKLSITLNKFDELHHFSESMLAEVEKLQSQLHDRDAEVSFLRQEVTRCTNEALVTSQTNKQRNSNEVFELLTWLAALVSEDVNLLDSTHINENKEIIQKKITSILSELADMRAAAQNSDTLLQIERSKVEGLTKREEILERSLHEKEMQLNMLAVGGDNQPSTATSEILEVEPVISKRTVPGPSTASQVRSLRKANNNDQLAIAIDVDHNDSGRLEDDDDEKAHGFRSLTSSRIVPKFTRPVTDMVDGLWVSCDRTLMRQPALRLGIILYWAVLHALLAAFVV